MCPSQEVLEGWPRRYPWCRVAGGLGGGVVLGEHGGVWWWWKEGKGKGAGPIVDYTIL